MKKLLLERKLSIRDQAEEGSFGKSARMNVIQCYSSTNNVNLEHKDAFSHFITGPTDCYGLLECYGWNSQHGHGRVMERRGYGVLNYNGESLAEFFGMNNLITEGTSFPQKEIYKISWNSPNWRQKPQIDYLLINGKLRQSLRYVRVKRGADVEPSP